MLTYTETRRTITFDNIVRFAIIFGQMSRIIGPALCVLLKGSAFQLCQKRNYYMLLITEFLSGVLINGMSASPKAKCLLDGESNCEDQGMLPNSPLNFLPQSGVSNYLL